MHDPLCITVRISLGHIVRRGIIDFVHLQIYYIMAGCFLSSWTNTYFQQQSISVSTSLNPQKLELSDLQICISHHDKCEMISHCFYNICFPDYWWVEYLFKCLLTTLISSLVNWLFISFFHWVVSFYWFIILYYPKYQYFVTYMHCKYLLPDCGLSFFFFLFDY